MACAYSPDGSHLVTGAEKELKVWSRAATRSGSGSGSGCLWGGEPVKTMDFPFCSCVRFSPDGSLVAFGSFRVASVSFFLASSFAGAPAWSLRTHRFFPAGFRAAVKTLLLCHRRDNSDLSALPKELIFHILEFFSPSDFA
jgi:WD40 repeat protein